MWLTILIALLAVVLVSRLLRRSRGDLERIPGPSWASLVWSFLNGEAKKVDHKKMHLMLTAMAKECGPIMKIPELNGSVIVVVNDYDLIYQVLVTKGKEVGGRINIFTAKDAMGHTGILQNLQPDAKWKLLRKLTHAHIRQFGEGMTDLQDLLMKVGESMLDGFARNENVPLDPTEIIETTALKSMMFILAGHIPRDNDPVVALMRKIDDLARILLTASPSFSGRLLNAFPWLRHTGMNSTWSLIQETLALQDELIELLDDLYKSDPQKESLYKVFKERLENDDGFEILTAWDFKKTIYNLITAGIVTSTETFRALINHLAHQPEIQVKMFEEIQRIVPAGEDITVQYRHQLNYCKAVLLEVFRYFAVAPVGVPHTTCVDVKIGDHVIPSGTVVFTLMWKLNHDPEFWTDPEVFKPERFLDENGETFPVDHPRRKRLMPFGAGPRLCIAETMATVRQFLWLTNMVNRFKIKPAPGNTKNLTDAESYNFEATNRSLPYEVIFTKRE